jgi:O-antigen ligase
MRPQSRIFFALYNGVSMTDNTPKTSSFLPLAFCLILAYLLPYHMYPFMAFYNNWLAFFGIVLVIAVLCNNESTAIRLPWISVIPLGLIALIGIQYTLGKFTVNWDVILPIAYLVGAAFAIIAGATLSSQPQGTYRLCSTLAWVHLTAGLVSALIATLQITGTETQILPFAMPMPHDRAIRPYANLGQPNHLALLFCLAISSAWMLYQSGKLLAVGAVSSILILLWGLALTQSRIGWIILPLFILFIIGWRTSLSLKPIPLLLPPILAIVYLVLILVLPEIDFGVALEGRVSSPEERVNSLSERWIFFRQAWQMSLNHPWLGAGWYEFGPQQIQIGADFPPTVYSQHAHNIVLSFAAELGWPATILIFAALAYWFYQSCLQPISKRAVTPESGFASLFLSAILIHSLVEYPLWYAYVLVPTALVMGMIHHAELDSRVLTLPRHTLLIVFMLSAAGMLTVATDYRRLVTGFRALGWENLGLKADEGTTERPEWTLFPHYYDYFQFAKSKARENMSAEEIAFMERSAKRFGYTPVMMRMSLIYALNGRSGDAVRTLQTLKNLHPGHYLETYFNWQAMAKYQPEKYAEIFKQIPPPIPTIKATFKQPESPVETAETINQIID